MPHCWLVGPAVEETPRFEGGVEPRSPALLGNGLIVGALQQGGNSATSTGPACPFVCWFVSYSCSWLVSVGLKWTMYLC